MDITSLLVPLAATAAGFILALAMMLGLRQARLSRWPILLFGSVGAMLSVIQVAQAKLTTLPSASEIDWPGPNAAPMLGLGREDSRKTPASTARD
jgi:hypothetical protein